MSNIRDIQRRLVGIYVVIDKKVARISDVGIYSTSGSMWIELQYSTKSVRKNLDTSGIYFKYPTLGYINTDKYSIYMSRNATRQWSVGLITEHLVAAAIPFNVRHYAITEGRIIGSALATRLYFNKFPSYRECIEDVITNKVFSRAFHNSWAIGLATRKKYPVLYYKNNQIGKLTSANTIVLLHNCELYKKEIEMIMPGINVA